MTLFDSDGASAFLRKHWQQTAAFFRGGMRDVVTGLDWRRMAIANDVESRRVTTLTDGRFGLEHGPFDASVLDASGEPPWTVLVQDADQHEPALRPLLDAFRFLPRWRLDDVMLSFATDGGSVGPHVDQYDVFLIQAQGERRWLVGDGHPVSHAVPDGELGLVEPFDPVLDVVAGPGDVLYLPPGVAHHGVARGECVTYSVGFRAPSQAELAAALLEQCDPHPRYRDPPLAPMVSTALIDDRQIGRALEMLRSGLPLTLRTAAHCLGRLVTEPKDWLCPEPPEIALEAQAAEQRMASGQTAIVCHHATRIAIAPSVATLFVNGEALLLDNACLALAETLADRRKLDATTAKSARQCPASLRLLVDLLNLGAVYCIDER